MLYRILVVSIVVICLLLTVLTGILLDNFMTFAPHEPIGNHTVEFVNHGTSVYVTSLQNILYWGATFFADALFLIGVLIAYFGKVFSVKR